MGYWLIPATITLAAYALHHWAWADTEGQPPDVTGINHVVDVGLVIISGLAWLVYFIAT